MKAGIIRPPLSLDRFLMDWLSLYAVALVLFPPVRAFGKLIYAAEWMLIPILGLVLFECIRGKWVRPPRELVYVWVGLLVAFFSGMFRGDLVYQLSVYTDLNNVSEERFTYLQDGIRLARWFILFSMPWLFSHFNRRIVLFTVSDFQNLFLKVLQVAITLSAVLAASEHFGWIRLAGVYGARSTSWWTGRSYGTFASPLEASLVYALNIILIISGAEWGSSVRVFLRITACVVCLYALFLTSGVSAFVILALTLVIQTKVLSQKKWRTFFVVGSVALFFSIFKIIPPELLDEKMGSLHARTYTWISWFGILPKKPWLLFFGSGFSSLVVDNSGFLILISGGALLLIPFIFWMKRLAITVHSTHYYPFLFWILSWFTLDSLGYWGIGRIMWTLLALAYLGKSSPAKVSDIKPRR